MDIDNLLATNTGVTSQNKTKENQTGSGFQDALLAATKSAKKSTPSTEELSDAQKIYNEIIDKGFAKWTQEMRKEELEKKLRAQILDSLGLTEDELGYMPAEKIAEIEKIIQELMQQIMAEQGQDKAKEQQEKGQVYVPVIVGAVA
jgi:hypothetical protein